MLAGMSGVPYDPEHIARFYDEYGEREWERFDISAMDGVGLEVHLRLLGEHIHDGDRVLDAGAGPGRFTLELARLGARVVVGDISPAQLELHAEKTASVEDSIDSRELLDITDLGRFPDGSFDAVVCFGGPLSYVLGEADRALAELLRVTKHGGRVLLSVMSLLGAARAFFDQLPGLVDEFGWQRAVVDVFETGDLDGELNNGHVLRLYRWSSLEQLLGRHPCRVIAASAANFLSAGTDAWDERFLEIELQACREPGALDGGTHIVAVLERT
jgi:SAM-dependent methyltransferase